MTGCGHVKLAATVDYSTLVLYNRCTPEIQLNKPVRRGVRGGSTEPPIFVVAN